MRNKITAAILFIMIPLAAFAQTADEIIARADQAQTFSTIISTGEFRITDRFGMKISTFKSWGRGENESLIEFTSKAERGQKVLRTEKEIYLFYPDAEELIRMQGAALRQGMLGSDISYEDMTGGKDRKSQYEAVLEGSGTAAGRDCWIISMTATTRTVAYPKQKLWIDKKNYIVMKGEYYTRSGRLLKEIEVLDVRDVGGRELAVETRITDKMKSDSETLLILKDIEFNKAIDPSVFSLEELSW